MARIGSEHRGLHRRAGKVFEQLLVHVPGFAVPREDSHENPRFQHVERPVPQRRAAHTLAVQMIRLLDDESSGVRRCQRRASANQEDVADVAQ